MVKLFFSKSFICLINLFIFADQLKAVKLDENGNLNIKPAMKVNDIIGKSLPSIGAYKKLDNSKQVVALIDDVSL